MWLTNQPTNYVEQSPSWEANPLLFERMCDKINSQ
jgi:hypothetical protein